jgi:hypothetical protein
VALAEGRNGPEQETGPSRALPRSGGPACRLRHHRRSALQVRQQEPRTTLDIDIAVLNRETIPRAALRTAGFQFGGTSEHSENWTAADGTPVQFTDDPAMAPAVMAAGEILLDAVALRVIRIVDLLHEKLRAGSDPACRRSKRLQDLADAQALLEANPELVNELTGEERDSLDQLPR